MAEREERRTFAQSEDLDEGGREEQLPPEHERVNASDVRQGIPDAASVMGNPHSSFSANDTVDEETENAFREAVEEMYNEGGESAET